jgi:hypothetical protein
LCKIFHAAKSSKSVYEQGSVGRFGFFAILFDIHVGDLVHLYIHASHTNLAFREKKRRCRVVL